MSKSMVRESTLEYEAGFSVFTCEPLRKARPTPFMPRLMLCDWSLNTPTPNWL